MDLYLAGAISGGNIPRDIKSKFFEGEPMDIYLAGIWPWKNEGLYDETLSKGDLFVLESYYYVDEWTEKYIPRVAKFMLDSGAFTFMMQRKSGENINWDAYIERYAEFINRNNVELFFELDIDKIIGIKEVERLRNRLEKLTGKQCIPVWHKYRGKDYFLRMCDEYKYVALGGIVDEISPKEYKYFPWFIDRAHERGCKIHGLGFTNLKGLEKCHFDSVDSTSWTSGNRFGTVYLFTGKTMIKKDRKENERMTNTKELALHNFNEWVKFQRYAENHL